MCFIGIPWFCMGIIFCYIANNKEEKSWHSNLFATHCDFTFPCWVESVCGNIFVIDCLCDVILHLPSVVLCFHPGLGFCIHLLLPENIVTHNIPDVNNRETAISSGSWDFVLVNYLQFKISMSSIFWSILTFLADMELFSWWRYNWICSTWLVTIHLFLYFWAYMGLQLLEVLLSHAVLSFSCLHCQTNPWFYLLLFPWDKRERKI